MRDEQTRLKEKKVKCSKCGYQWVTLSKMNFVSCPSCLNKVKLKDLEDYN